MRLGGAAGEMPIGSSKGFAASGPGPTTKELRGWPATHSSPALDVHSTERVLDVATGSGNAPLAVARRGSSVVGLDYVPALLERARRRAEAEGLEAEFVEGDAEALPFGGATFDVVSSVFGAMFAPD